MAPAKNMVENTFPRKISDSNIPIIVSFELAINSGASTIKLLVTGLYKADPKITIFYPFSKASY